jgi:putative transposase
MLSARMPQSEAPPKAWLLLALGDHSVPGLGKREFSPRTLLYWRSAYRHYGLESLKGKTRQDRGQFRRLSAEAQLFLTEALRSNPRLTATTLYELAKANLLGLPPCSLSPVQRFLRQIELPQTDQPERRRFTFAHANACWQSDVCVGPCLASRKQKANLIAILDDASRLFVHAAFCVEANNLAFESVFKTALLKRGIPQRLYVDNGKIYHSRQIQTICTHLGCRNGHRALENPKLKGVLPKDDTRPALGKQTLGDLIDLIGTIGLGDPENRSKNILGRVYEYFL